MTVGFELQTAATAGQVGRFHLILTARTDWHDPFEIDLSVS
jgi:hypothetical protein